MIESTEAFGKTTRFLVGPGATKNHRNNIIFYKCIDLHIHVQITTT